MPKTPNTGKSAEDPAVLVHFTTPWPPYALEMADGPGNKYVRCKKSLHVPLGRVEEWEQLAAADGESFSNWIQLKVEKALGGPGEAVVQLRRENQELKDELTGLRGANGKLAIENANLNMRIERLETTVSEALHRAVQLAG